MAWSKRFGPGLLVTAAFIGPGTVTTATLAGSGFGFALLWVLLFSIVATIVLQEMSARLGLVSRQGLGEAVRNSFSKPWLRMSAVVLVVAAIGIGNAAFQTGNIMGAAMGLELLTGISGPVWSGAVGLAALVLLATGTYLSIERLLVVLVGVMSAVFVVTAVMVRPDVGGLAGGLLVPTLPGGSLTIALALVGTTVVPYNLFLHSSLVIRKWPASVPVMDAIRESRLDTVVAVVLGGTVTLAIVITAAVFFEKGTTVANAAVMATQLEPLLGSAARSVFAAGLFVAGLTSGITAPLAAAYATAGALGWEPDLRSWRFRGVWSAVIVVGTLLAIAYGRSPVSAIIFAQVANGILLPIIVVFLLVVVNRRSLLGEYVNGALANILGGGVVLVTTGLGIYKLWQVVESLTR